MLDLPYYRLELDDYAAAAFTSFSKDYYGTFDDILRLMDALENDEDLYLMPMEIWQGQNCIGIDCGCAYPDGRLACLRLEDRKVFCSEDVYEQI